MGKIYLEGIICVRWLLPLQQKAGAEDLARSRSEDNHERLSAMLSD